MFAYANIQQAVILSRELDPVNRTVVHAGLGGSVSGLDIGNSP